MAGQVNGWLSLVAAVGAFQVCPLIHKRGVCPVLGTVWVPGWLAMGERAAWQHLQGGLSWSLKGQVPVGRAEFNVWTTGSQVLFISCPWGLECP
jgi:hypothetical protein